MTHDPLGASGPFGSGRSSGSRADDAIGLALADPAWVETEWRPQEYQARVLSCLRGLTFAVGGLGSGKSEAGALLLLKWALRHPRRRDGNPTRWYVVGPEFALIRHEQFSKILAHARRLKGLGLGAVVRRVVYGQDPRIVLADGQVLVGRSGDQYRRMEGQEIDGVWIDEAQRQPEKAFQIAMSRVRSSDDIRAVITASPEDSPGWVWRAISGDPSFAKVRRRLLARGSGVRVFRWSSRANAANDGGVLDVIGAILESTSEAFSVQKLDGRFPGTPEAPSVAVIDYGKAFAGELVLREHPRARVLGVDIGESEDFTWLTVLSSKGIVLAQERWNAGSPDVPRQGFYPFLEAAIEQLARTSGVAAVVVDTAKAGKPVAQSLEAKLRARGIRVVGVDTAIPRRKSEAIESLALGLSRGDVRIPTRWTGPDGSVHLVQHVPQLRKEFEELLPRDHGQGRRSWDHPRGGHDDGVVALALAYYGLTQRPPATGDYSAWKTLQLGSRRFG